MSDTKLRPAGWQRWLTAIFAALALVALALPAVADPIGSLLEWEQRLDRAGAAADYEEAVNIITGPVIQKTEPEVAGKLAEWLRKSFGEGGFRADTISVLSTAEKGERRLFALFQDEKYAFLFMVFHKRVDEWIVLNFSLEPNYPAIRQRF